MFHHYHHHNHEQLLCKLEKLSQPIKVVINSPDGHEGMKGKASHMGGTEIKVFGKAHHRATQSSDKMGTS